MITSFSTISSPKNSLHFPPDDDEFARVLQMRVREYFRSTNQSGKANPRAWAKATLLALVYGLVFITILTTDQPVIFFFGWVILGSTKIFLALNVAHDAAHQAFAFSARTNAWLLNLFDLMGASGYMWKLRHVHSHHPYANIPNMDADIKQSNLVRIFPNATVKWFHRWQHAYMPLLYAFYSLHWLLVRDPKDFLKMPENTLYEKKPKKSAVVKLICSKFLYLITMLGLPIWLSAFSVPMVIAGFVLMHIGASYTVALALASVHVGDEAVFPEPSASGEMPHSYIRHQVYTTTDFATDNLLITHLYGGFNHHLIHHLFPHICHIHYPAITPILKQTCHDFGVPYRAHSSVWTAVSAHFRLLRERGRQLQRATYPEF